MVSPPEPSTATDRPSAMAAPPEPSTATDRPSAMVAAVDRVVLGHGQQTRLCIAALIAGHHILLHDEPGVGKTTLARAIAATAGGTFTRIQGTVDLLPGDLTGVTIVDPRTGQWSFRPGPLLSNIVLVDEINRLSPRTQSALLEAMAEGQITVDGESHRLPEPFGVIATMNPTGSAGTFPLVGGQLDRFGVSISLGAAGRAVENRLIHGLGGMAKVGDIVPEVSPEGLIDLRRTAAAVSLSDEVGGFVLDLVEALRLRHRLSTRAPLALVAIARAWAMMRGSDHVSPDDVIDVAGPTLAHRVVGSGETLGDGFAIVAGALSDVPVPRGR